MKRQIVKRPDSSPPAQSSICDYEIITVAIHHTQIQLWVFGSKEEKSHHTLSEWTNINTIWSEQGMGDHDSGMGIR